MILRDHSTLCAGVIPRDFFKDKVIGQFFGS